MGRKKGARNRTEYTIRCDWCGEIKATTRTDTQYCGPVCRGRMHRYREMTGFDPDETPGQRTAEEMYGILVGMLLLQEQRRRECARRENEAAGALAAKRAMRPR